MYEGIRELQLQFEQLQTEAKRLNAGEVGQLMIGMLEGQIMDDRLRNILRYFRQRYPELQLRMHRCTFRQLERQLLNGELDLGITLQMEVEDNEDLCYQPYQSLKNYIILPKEHPLAEKTDLLTQRLCRGCISGAGGGRMSPYFTDDECLLPAGRFCAEAVCVSGFVGTAVCSGNRAGGHGAQ